jgi:hypothetical protein
MAATASCVMAMGRIEQSKPGWGLSKSVALGDDECTSPYKAGALGVPMRGIRSALNRTANEEIPIGASTPRLQRRSF